MSEATASETTWCALHVFIPDDARERLLELLAQQAFPTITSYVDENGRALVRESHYGEGRMPL